VPPEGVGGRSLVPALHGEALADAPQLLENLSTYYSHGWSPLAGVVSSGAKLIKAPRSELYDLRQDPGETHDVLEQERERAQGLKGVLEQLIQSHPLREGFSSEIDVSDEARERLQALGYVGGRPRPAPGTQLPDPKDKMEIVRQHDRAASLMREGKAPQALAIMKKLVDEDPTNPQFLSHYGSLLGMVGQWPEAMAILERAAAAGEHSAATYFNLAEAHARLDHRDQSEAYLRLTLAKQPSHVGAMLKLAELLEKKGAVEEARREYQTLLQSWEGEEAMRAKIKLRLDHLSASK